MPLTAPPTAASENLYLAAYCTTHGARLKRITVSRSNGRATAVFELEGADVHRLFAEYYGENAIVRLSAFRQALEELKDQLFATLKKTETERRTHGDHRPPHHDRPRP